MSKITIGLAIAVVSAVFGTFATEDDAQPKLWAVLVAGSNGFYNYRHQADVYHAYQILHKHGIPDERIIMFHYDDIANDPENPFPGKVFNKPGGPDVYPNVLKDYTGEDVTVENFIKVLQGDSEGMKGIGSGRVLKSGPNDHVFVNLVDHGGPGIFAFPSEELTVDQLMNAIKYMHQHKMYGKLVFYVEACESGSMFDGVLPADINAFATTASNPDESSWGCYCDDPLIPTCLGDLYSVNWMEDSDREDIEKETLQKQYSIVRQETNLSHVMEYGEKSLAKLTVGQFQGLKQAARKTNDEANANSIRPSQSMLIRSEDIALHGLQRKMGSAKTKQEYLKLQKQMDIHFLKRRLINATVEAIVMELVGVEAKEELMQRGEGRVLDTVCHHRLVKTFSASCFNFGKNPYALRLAYVLNNVCSAGIDVNMAENAIRNVCGNGAI